MHLSSFYDADPAHRAYYVAVDATGQVIGGGGLAEFEGFPNTAEMQKLYLADAAKGHGLGARLVGCIEQAARRMGCERLYLETHSNLKAAIHLYEKLGYQRIQKPALCQHSATDHFFIKRL
ncbi:GNAT family N-acetyltransferase [Olsenella uli]|uniref:GNAT family N-acetyltransferase n=2 Tax=Olsenella uli TaxID=133926 RepID=UPI00325FD230